MLSPQTIKIVQETAPVVAGHAVQITTAFYIILFEKYPELKPLFNSSHQDGSQQHALAGAIVAYASNIDNLDALGGAVEQISERHASLHITADMYPKVGDALLTAIVDVLGEAITPEIGQAWTEAYEFLASILTSVEQGKYDATAKEQGGWVGDREFILQKKEEESESISSFYLVPKDEKEVVSFTPGQYTCIKLNVPEHGSVVRNYSLSSNSTNNGYRISVKKESKGLVSGFLHESLEVGGVVSLSAPRGHFKVEKSNQPIAFLSGGVGITPAMAALETHHESLEKPFYFIHAAKNGKQHAFKKRVVELASKNDHVKPIFFYDEPQAEDDNFEKGYVTLEKLQSYVADPMNTRFFICGPVAMMKASFKNLKEWGIPQENISYEYFGPNQDIEA